MPRDAPFVRSSPLVEIGVGLLLLGALTLVFFPFYPYGALALAAIVGVLRSAETYAILFFLPAGEVAFGAIGLGHRRALQALQQRVDELELALADQGVRFLVAIEEKQREQRLAKDRSPDPSRSSRV